MGITDELREYTEDQIKWLDMTKVHYHKLFAIADRIDAKHNEIRDFCERLEGATTDREDVTLWGVDYTALPLDADNVPIHIGDVMAYADNTKPMEVVAFVPPAVFLTEDGPRYANMCRHYQPDSWERIIEDATALGAQMGRSTTQVDDLVARCKALAGEE